MSDSQEFMIYMMDIAQKDVQMVKRVLDVTGGSKRSYKITDSDEPHKNKIFMVNSDDNESIKKMESSLSW